LVIFCTTDARNAARPQVLTAATIGLTITLLISLLGPPRTAHSRLTFAQAFNSLGTTVFPYIGSILILGALPKIDMGQLSDAALQAYRSQESKVVVHTYLGLAVALLLIAALVWAQRGRLPRGDGNGERRGCLARQEHDGEQDQFAAAARGQHQAQEKQDLSGAA